MRRLALIGLLIVFATSLTLAKKDPAVEARKAYWLTAQKVKEQHGCGDVPLFVVGKQKDVLRLLVADADPYRLQQIIYPICVKPLFDEKGVEMRQLGFSAIEIKTNVRSATYPDGVWRLPFVVQWPK